MSNFLELNSSAQRGEHFVYNSKFIVVIYIIDSIHSNTLAKRLTPDEMDLVKQLDQAEAKPAHIAEVLNDIKGVEFSYNAQFILN